MGSFNNKIVTERNQRPSFNGRTILRAYFMRNGEYVSLDETQVSSVMLFNKVANTSPSSLLETSSGLVKASSAANAVWRWGLSGAMATGPGLLLSESQYVPASSTCCSSIYSVADGRLAVILNGVDIVSSVLADGTQVSSNQQLSGEPAAPYIDVWTVKLCAGCDWVTFINDTQFFQNNAVILSEPLLCSTKERLYNKRIEKGSIEKIKIGTEITIENKNIDESVKNVLRQGLITSGAMEIIYHNDDDIHSPAWSSIDSFADTTGSVEITGDNTFVYIFDTTDQKTGTYTVQLKYNILEETKLSPLMYFKIV